MGRGGGGRWLELCPNYSFFMQCIWISFPLNRTANVFTPKLELNSDAGDGRPFCVFCCRKLGECCSLKCQSAREAEGGRWLTFRTEKWCRYVIKISTGKLELVFFAKDSWKTNTAIIFREMTQLLPFHLFHSDILFLFVLFEYIRSENRPPANNWSQRN